MTKNFVRSTVIAALALTGVSFVQAQTVLQLGYPSSAPGTIPCIYTTNGAGISADPLTGDLLAVGDFGTGCPQTGPTLPPPVIVPGPENWALPQPWSINQVVFVQWAAPNATQCVYGGSNANGWPSGGVACNSPATCETLHNVNLSPPGAGTYQFSLTCTNPAPMGSDTSISDQRTVSNPPINPPVINPGPPNWVVLPWTSGQTKSVIWSATNADSCVVTATTPSGVTTQQFLGGITSCLSTGCGNANALTLAAPVAGQYSATVTCSKTGVADVLSTNSWTVTQNSSATCLNPSPNWNRVESAPIYYQGSTSGFNQGVKDVTAYDSIWGRAYNVSGDPITKQWPGVEQQLVLPRFGNLQYIAAKFRTPAAGGTPGHTLTLDPTSFSANGGGNPSFPNKAKLSITVSTKCGDFNTASPDIPPLCYKSQMGANATFSAYTSVPSSQCSLQPNTDYYLNIIYSPLTSPATAVFNGNNGGVSLLQNTGVIP